MKTFRMIIFILYGFLIAYELSEKSFCGAFGWFTSGVFLYIFVKDLLTRERV